MSETRAVWQSRLGAPLDPRARRLNDSLAVDARLWPEELALTRAYAPSLVEAGVLIEEDATALTDAAAALEADLGSGAAVLEGEDVHSAVEAALEARCGEPARRLHTGRSRNDQVATLVRLRAMQLCDLAVEGLQSLERAIVQQVRSAGDLAVASYTHLQPAQPVRLAWVERGTEEATLLGSSLEEGKAIYLWLKLPDVDEPRAYSLPWDPAQAEALEQARRKANEEGNAGVVRVRQPFSPALEALREEPMFYAPAQPAPPPKEAESAG